jgi:GH25 family lysozyme M1 (1,4-beta-N-acetylmuramidase)
VTAVVGVVAVVGLQTVDERVPADAATTLTGVDVSRWDHPNGVAIDWPKVKAAGRSFAIVKATEDTNYTNPYFSTDYSKAKAAGLIVGAYHFAQPRRPLSSAADQARHYVRTVGTFKGTGVLPPILDLECNGAGNYCDYGSALSVSELRTWTKTWIDTARAMTGRTPIIYTGDYFWRSAMGNTNAFVGNPLWYARYTTTTPTAATIPGGWPRWTFWQYTSTGSTPGIPDTGDINRFNGDLASLRALADGSDALGLPSEPTQAKAALSGAGWTKLTWQPPATNGGAPVVDYTVSVDGGDPQVTPTRAFVATGLAPGNHTFTIRARSIAGDGAPAPLDIAVAGSGAAPPSGATRLTVAMPSAASASTSVLAAARVVRIDTGQAVGGVPLTWRRVPEKGPEPAPLVLTTAGDGTVSTLMKFGVDTWTKASIAGTPGVNAASASRSVRVTPWLSASLSTNASVPRRSTVSLKARTSYLFAGESVLRQQYVSGKWRTLSSRPLRSDGSVTFSVYAGTKGTKLFRVVLPSTSAHNVKASSTLVLRVR